MQTPLAGEGSKQHKIRIQIVDVASSLLLPHVPAPHVMVLMRTAGVRRLPRPHVVVSPAVRRWST